MTCVSLSSVFWLKSAVIVLSMAKTSLFPFSRNGRVTGMWCQRRVLPYNIETYEPGAAGRAGGAVIPPVRRHSDKY